MPESEQRLAPAAILPGIRPEHLYKAIGLAFLLALTYRYFQAFTQTLLLIYAAAIVAVALNPIARRMPVERKWVAALIGVVILSLIGLLLYWGIPMLMAQVRDLVQRVPELTERFQRWSESIRRSTGLNIPILGSERTGALRNVFDSVGGEQVVSQARGLLEIILVPLVILFGGLYALANPNQRLLVPMLRIVPRDLRESFREILELLGERLLGWLQGIGMAMLGVGLLSVVTFWLIGVPNAVLLGLFNGVMEFIPIFGPWVGGLAATLVALSVSPTLALYVAIAALAIQQIESNVITPWAMSSKAEVHPLITLFSLILFGSMFGFLGLLLALPLVLLFWTIVEVLWVERAIDTDDDRITPVVKE